MSPAPSCRFSAYGEMLHGSGALAELPSILDAKTKYLVVTDPGLVEAGISQRLVEMLSAAGILHHVFDGILPDPTVAQVEAGLEMARACGSEAIIGLGGGSAIDAAKALAARMTWPTTLRHYGDGVEVPEPIVPLFAIPTTAGTGSEATRVAVITDSEVNEKMAIRGQALLPRAAVLDPTLLASLPPQIAAACGADALTHAVEAFVSREANPMTDALALAAIEIIGAWLPELVHDPADAIAAEEMLLASNLAGRAFTHAGLGLAHSLAEPLGAYHHVSHGLACALFLPVVMEFNAGAAPARYSRVARALGCNPDATDPAQGSQLAVEAVRSLFAGVGLPATYGEASIQFEMIPEMAAQVLPQNSTRCNPRSCSLAEAGDLFARLHVA